MKTQNQNFTNLVSKFGKKSGSRLFPLFNYFFVPQTKSQLREWKKSIKNGICNQNLLFNERDFDLVKAFCPEVGKHYTKSKMIRVTNFDLFVESVSSKIKIS
jgi:hypothetical protein